MKVNLVLLAAASILVAGVSSLRAEPAARIVSAGGPITETIFALGAQDQLVAVDISSVYPVEGVEKLPKVGYARQLAAEGILSVNPTVLLANEDAGPSEVLTQVEKAGVKIERLSNEHTAEAAVERIRKIGDIVGKKAEAAALADGLIADLKTAKERADAAASKPKVLFIYTRGPGVMNVSGTKTSADAIIALAGGTNAITGYENYKPLTAEAAVSAAPDVILVTTRGLESSGGIDELLKQPGLITTPAGQAKRVIAMDDLLLLGFGPRLGKAALELNEKIHAQPSVAQQ